MFLQLYDKNHNKIAGLAVAKAATVESVLSTGDGTLSFLYPLKEAAQLVNEAYIRTKTDEYIIKEVQPDSSDLWCSVKATLNVEDLEGICWPRFESVEQTIDDCLKLAIAGTGWAIGSCTVTRRRTIRKTECSGWDIIQQARKTYRCEIWFDTIEKKIHIAEKRGQDKGMYFTDTLNLRKLAIQSTSYDFCTRIRAEGKDGLTFADINGGKNYVENHQYSDKNLEIYWKDERYTVAESLKEDAEAKLNELSKPVVAYAGEIIDLAKASPKTYRILDFGLGDTVELVDSTTGTKEKQRIVKMVEYPDEPEKNTCEFANRTASFEELQQEQNEVNSTVNNITADDGTISPSALDLDAITIHVQNIYAQELNAVKARIGELETTTLKATEAIINTAMIEELLAGKATILDLNALTARVEVAEIKVGYVDTLVSDVADIKMLVNGNLTSVNIQAGGITSDSLTIRNGFITNAMIGSVEAGKITTGILNTSLVTVQGADGRMAIKDNTIQIKDASRVRVQIGKDAAGDYSMYVWDASGALMFDAAGLHAPGIKSGIIRNDMVADNAGIAGTKIDIVSLITSINGNTTKIDSTVIKMDSSGQTLNLAFNTLKTTAEAAKSTTETHTTQINAINGKIDTLIQDTTIVRDGQTVKLKDEYNKTVATVGGIQTTIGNQQTTIANLTNDLNNLSVGGRNLFRCSGNFTTIADLNSMWSSGGGGLSINNSTTYLGKPTIQTTVGTGITGIWYELEPDTEYTYSIMVKASAAFKGSAVTPIHYWAGTNQANEGKISVLKHDTSYTTADVGKFKKLYIVFKLVNGGKWFKPYIYFGSSQSITFYIANLKLEKGNKPTDWTPAPEDVQGQITEVKTQQATFEQTFNGFKTTVSNTYATKAEFNSLEVGGNNLLKDTVKYGSGWSAGNCTKTIGQTDPYGGNKAVLVSGNTDANSYLLTGAGIIQTTGYHTLTVWLKGTKAGNVKLSINNRNNNDTTEKSWKTCAVTTQWKQYSLTVNIESIASMYHFVLGGWSSWSDLSLGVYMAFPTLVRENDQITALNDRFGSYSTTAQMNSAIDQKANQITQTVSQTYTTKADFNNLSVGGRNYYKKTTPISLSGGAVTIDRNNAECPNGFYTVGIKEQTGNWRIGNVITSNGYWTISFEVRGSQNSAVGFYLDVCDLGMIRITTTADNTWKKVEHTVNVTNHDNSPTVYNFVDMSAFSWAYFYIRNIKIEKGQKATDWTPAPEDVDASITAVDSKFANYSTTTQMNSAIDQKANQINLNVSQNYTTKTEFNTQMSINQQTKQNGIELFDQTYRGSFAALPFAQGAHTIVSATATGGASTDSNLIKTVNAPFLYTDYIPCNIDLPYYWSFEVYSEGTTDGTVYVQACFYNDKQASVATNEGAVNLISNLAITKANTWQKAEGWCGPVNTMATHKKACYMRIRYLPRYNGKTGVTYIRNVSLKQLGANQIATTNQLQSALLINVNGITSRVTAVETKATTTANGLTSLTSRVSTAESKLTATSLITTFTTAINGGTKFTTTKFTMDNTGLTIKGGGIKIQNNAGANVLYGDTSGNLIFGGTLSQVSTSTSKTGIEIKNGQINMRAWQNGDIATGSFIGYGGGSETGVNFAMVANGQFGVNDSSGYYMLKIRNSRIHELYGDWFDVKAKLHCFSNVANKFGHENNIFIGSDFIYSMLLSGNPNWYIHCNTNIGAYGINIWSSDGRMKANIRPTQVSALDEIARFKHRAFQWKDGGHFEKIGYIAQELEQIDPDYVERIPQKDMNGNVLDYRLQINEHRIIPLLTKAVQELAEENKELRRQIQYILQKTGIGSVPAPVSRMAFAAEYVPQYPEGIRYYVPPEPEPIQPPRAV